MFSVLHFLLRIEKCSSPTGDGNLSSTISVASATSILRNVVPRQGTETKNNTAINITTSSLRNVVPRQGTETIFALFILDSPCLIEKCSSPTGDGNCVASLARIPSMLLRNVVPRQGTKTCSSCNASRLLAFSSLRNVVPRQGTETL